MNILLLRLYVKWSRYLFKVSLLAVSMLLVGSFGHAQELEHATPSSESLGHLDSLKKRRAEFEDRAKSVLARSSDLPEIAHDSTELFQLQTIASILNQQIAISENIASLVEETTPQSPSPQTTEPVNFIDLDMKRDELIRLKDEVKRAKEKVGTEIDQLETANTELRNSEAGRRLMKERVSQAVDLGEKQELVRQLKRLELEEALAKEHNSLKNLELKFARKNLEYLIQRRAQLERTVESRRTQIKFLQAEYEKIINELSIRRKKLDEDLKSAEEQLQIAQRKYQREQTRRTSIEPPDEMSLEVLLVISRLRQKNVAITRELLNRLSNENATRLMRCFGMQESLLRFLSETFMWIQ